MKNFTISLYAFHLARSFNDPTDGISESAAQSFGKEIQSKLTPEIKLKNELITQLLHDTYFTDLTFSIPEIDLKLEQIGEFKPTLLLPQNINASLGQTIGIYGKVIPKIAANKDLADSLVRNFLKGTLYENDQIAAFSQGNLFGIPLFEYFCQAPTDTNKKAPGCHILVLLNYQDGNALQKLSHYYQDIVDLLCSYHKINFVNQQAELSYQAALKAAQEIDKEINDFENYAANTTENLDKLSTMLNKLPLLTLNHANYCGELEYHRTTMQINHQNYQDSLQKLLSAGSQLDSWEKFSHQTQNILLKQIQFWLNYMSPRKELGQQLTASIRGIVEIEQVKSDRHLQTVIAAVGVGIGASGVAATASPYFLEPKAKEKEYSNLPLSLLFSLVVGVLGGAIAVKIMPYLQKRSKKP